MDKVLFNTIVYINTNSHNEELSLLLKSICINFFAIKQIDMCNYKNVSLFVIENDDDEQMFSYLKNVNNQNVLIILNEHLLKSAVLNGMSNIIIKPHIFPYLSDKLLQMSININQQNATIEKINRLNEYKKAINKSSIFIKMDIDGNFIYANNNFCNILAHDKKTILGKNFVDFDLYEPILDQIKHNISNNKPWIGSIELVSLDNLNIILDGHFLPLYNKNNTCKGIVAILHDITELTSYRNIIQTKLHKTKYNLSEKQHLINEYNKIFEEGIAMCRLDVDGNILKTSNAFDEIFHTKKLQNNLFFSNIINKNEEVFLKIQNSLSQKNIYKKSIKVNVNNTLNTFNITCIGIYSYIGELDEIVIIFENVSNVLNEHRKIYDMQIEFLYMLSQIIERHSEENGFHTKRVAEFSALLASAIGLDKEEVDKIKLASIMHDIGKLGIPYQVLTKTSSLTQKEREIMQKHAKIGYEILNQSNQPLLQMAATIALQHHERYDGTGYPNGLKGEQISIYGRIVAIADVFDALSNQRVYKNAWHIDDVYEYLKINKGIQFDPYLVDVFLSYKDIIDLILKDY